MTEPIPDYDKAGLLTLREGRVLLCRKKHTTSLLILPGGCKEPGEGALECLARELQEELGNVRAIQPKCLGTYTHAAAGSPGKTVRIELFEAGIEGEPSPQSEIRELLWFGQDDDPALLSPSLREKIFPDLVARGVLAWTSSYWLNSTASVTEPLTPTVPV